MNRSTIVFLGLFTVGIILRMVAFQQLHWFFGNSLHVDEITYSQGDSPPFERPPGNYLLASLSRDYGTLRTIFSMISMLPALFLFLFREKNLKNSISAGILAVEPTLAFSGLQVLPEAPAAALLTLALCQVEKNKLLAGWFIGAAALFRGELLIFLPVSLFFVRPLKNWGTVAVGISAAVIPLMMLNLLSGGSFAPGENGPLNLWLGSKPQLLEIPPGIEYEQLVGDSSFTDNAVESIADSPVSWLGLGFQKLAAFISIPGPGRNIESPFLLASTVLIFLMPLTGIILALGLAGSGRNAVSALFFTGILSAFIFFPSIRHRAVYIPALLLSASSMKWKPAIPFAVLIVSLSLFFKYPAEVRPGLTYVQTAGMLLNRGEFHLAMEHLDRAEALGFEGADIHNIRGACIASSGGEFRRAVEEFSMALELAPEYPSAWKKMAALLWNYGYTDDARFAAEKAVTLNPSLRAELYPLLSYPR